MHSSTNFRARLPEHDRSLEKVARSLVAFAVIRKIAD
jgi:hypothetical protein